MTITVTIDSLKDKYKSYLQAENSNINAFAPDSAWSILAGGTSGTLLDLYYNLQLVLNSVYVQNAVGDQVDLWLYRQGLPARGEETFGTISVVVTTSTPVVIPINTVFTDPISTNQYQNLQEFTVPDGVTEILLYATKAGSNYIEAVDALLTADTITVKVVTSINGQQQESDQEAINRVLTSLRAPISGARQTDYQVYALDYNTTIPTPIVTNSITIPMFISINNVGILGLFVMGATPITEYQLNQGLLPSTTFIEFSRELNPGTVIDVNDYIQSLRLVGLSIHVGTVITQVVATDALPLIVTISLVEGYNLATLISIPSQDQNNAPITIQLTVKELVEREIRRAICNQPFGGTTITTNNYITLDSIYYSVNLQLSYLNGFLAQILTDIQISGGNISVPNANFDLSNLYYIYDIESYNSLTIGTV